MQSFSAETEFAIAETADVDFFGIPVRSIEMREPVKRSTLPVIEKRGSVFTKQWVVDLMLDLCAYNPARDLAALIALEPAAGDGAFAVQMVKRLIQSCRTHGRNVRDAATALILVEIDRGAADSLRCRLLDLLDQLDVELTDAEQLCNSWIFVGDYLVESCRLPKVDFVIGNPPYIRLEDVGAQKSEIYRRLFPTMRGRADIYIGFYEAGLRQLKANGVSALICADRWMRNQYGSMLRAFIHRSFSVEWLIELHNADAFEEEVDAYPAITIIARREQEMVNVAEITAATSLEDLTFKSTEPWFIDAEPWPNADPKALRRLATWSKCMPTLETVETGTVVGIGVATGADKIFITKNPELVEQSRLLPLALGGDVSIEGLDWSQHFLVNPWNGKGLVDLNQYPKLKAYFQSHTQHLKNRHVGKNAGEKFYKTIDRVDSALTLRPKLYIPDIRPRLAPVLDSGNTYPHHNLYYITSRDWNLETLGGILMSEQAQLFITAYAMKMRGGYYRYQAQYLRRIRIPKLQDINYEDAIEFQIAFRNRDFNLATKVAGHYYIEPIE